MFLLPPFLRQFFGKRPKGKKPRVFLKDEQLVIRLKKIAIDQRRAEQEVYDDIIEAGMKVLQDKDEYAGIWDTLSQREQQVTALTCLGYRSYEIAGMLGISYETVRTHSKHVYAKFGLNRKELRLALKDWDFKEWLESMENIET
jgi:DNA-binding CsgD family transcriptional regulator